MPIIEIEDAPSKKGGGTPNSASGAPKRGPGRPSNASRAGQDINAALGTMQSLYGMLSTGAMLFGRQRTAELIALRTDQWQAANREAFDASPKLAKTIANVGQTSGVVTFLTANAVAFGTIFLALREENAAIAEAKAANDADASAS